MNYGSSNRSSAVLSNPIQNDNELPEGSLHTTRTDINENHDLNQVQTPELLSKQSFAVEGPFIDRHTKLSDLVNNMIANALSLTNQESQVLDGFINPARKLNEILFDRAETHGILTLLDTSIIQGR